MGQIAHGAIGAFAIGLVDHEHVGDLEDAGLDGLDLVAEPGHGDDDRGLRLRHDVDLVLPDADGLDDDDVEAHGVEHGDHVAGRARQAAEVAARGERADEDAVVGGVALHADAIAEDGAAGERRRRIDGDDADALASFAVVVDERVDDGRLARAGVAGDAEDVGAPGVRIEPLHHLDRARPRVVEIAHQRAPAVRTSPARTAGAPTRQAAGNEVPRDDHALHFVGALADLAQLAVAQRALDGELARVAVAAVDLDGAIAGAHRRLRRPQLRRRRFVGVALPLIAAARRRA